MDDRLGALSSAFVFQVPSCPIETRGSTHYYVKGPPYRIKCLTSRPDRTHLQTFRLALTVQLTCEMTQPGVINAISIQWFFVTTSTTQRSTCRFTIVIDIRVN